ncbi:NAD-dependent epimerase/dehydratase family protein [Burkholderia pyrrocinia]|uniref:NAD-dependent epimerase/dehydratase family protein n=1 Tax=Burkholderia pyrrocinia TaxID=60550 RepID=UPI002AB163EF|nr:NAD-dependent epimerase/dehydratase family protein [Burkholderia pyrrocinia]
MNDRGAIDTRAGQRILVTGSAGFLGSHTCKALAEAGHEPVTYDNLSTGHRDAVRREPLVAADMLDRDALSKTFAAHRPDVVIHFSALASVGESVLAPDRYYTVNATGTCTLLSEIRTALGTGNAFRVTGTDYPTSDGSAIRDYVHVSDLANAHLKATAYRCGGGNSVAPNTKLLSREWLAFVFARWPRVVLGCASARVDCLRSREFPFKVTPKGGAIDQDALLRVVAPYLLISLFCSLPVVAVEQPRNAAGFYLFSTLTSILYLAIAAVVAMNHGKEQGLAASTFTQMFFSRLPVRNALFVFALAMLLTGIGLRAPKSWQAMTWRSGLPAVVAPAPGEPVRQPEVGAYDPDRTLAAEPGLAFDHVFVSWNAPDIGTEIGDAYRSAQARSRSLMLTVEPWAAGGTRQGALLEDIAHGRYDAQIAATCSALAALKGPVFVRWGHEMEADTGRYPWAIGDASAYVGAYRLVVAACRRMTSQIRFVWSPAGNRNLDDYFPGLDYVDAIGLSVFDCPRCASWPAGGHFSAASILRTKYERVTGYGLPVIVTELGVDGSDSRKHKALDEFQRSLWRYPLLKAVIYFNAVDTPGAWPAHYVPDWRIPPAFLRTAVVAK